MKNILAENMLRFKTKNLNERKFKKTLNEAGEGFEPVKSNYGSTVTYYFDAGEPRRPLTSAQLNEMLEYDPAQKAIAMIKTNVLPTVEKFSSMDEFPKIIDIYASTSSSGTDQANAQVGINRLNAARQLVIEMFNRAAADKGGMKLDQAKLLSLITNKGTPNFDPSKLNPIYVGGNNGSVSNDKEQYIVIHISKLETIGQQWNWLSDLVQDLTADATVGDGLTNWGVDEDVIVKTFDEIGYMGGYSDLIDVNDMLKTAGYGGIEQYLNKFITQGITGMGSDTEERQQIVDSINMAASKSGKGNPAAISQGGEVVINPPIPVKTK